MITVLNLVEICDCCRSQVEDVRLELVEPTPTFVDQNPQHSITEEDSYWIWRLRLLGHLDENTGAQLRWEYTLGLSQTSYLNTSYTKDILFQPGKCTRA
ncbi:hypothetical protein AVEN_212771-1 [Araneus ventricosus]|uniref:Uncharacterized protein n=1 Tax=Araneus ventricosus TaxID=182803 RepID=A0A4Y2R6C4_ARAVE|nr:hypothetical protein AVEN_212771-1 [Araneus ventricosus]